MGAPGACPNRGGRGFKGAASGLEELDVSKEAAHIQVRRGADGVRGAGPHCNSFDSENFYEPPPKPHRSSPVAWTTADWTRPPHTHTLTHCNIFIRYFHLRPPPQEFADYLDRSGLRPLATCPYVYRQYSTQRWVRVARCAALCGAVLRGVRCVGLQSLPGLLGSVLHAMVVGRQACIWPAADCGSLALQSSSRLQAWTELRSPQAKLCSPTPCMPACTAC